MAARNASDGAARRAHRPGGRAALRLAAELAERHELTLYDAAYAAVAQTRGATLATLDRALLRAGLGSRPSELSAQLSRPDAED